MAHFAFLLTSYVSTVSTLLAVSEAEHVGTAEYHPAAGLICYVDIVLSPFIPAVLVR